MSSKEILLRDGSKYFLNSVTAEVVTDPNIWSETHVHSTGGGGFVHPTYGGHVSAPQVHSTVKERQSYFVKTEQGKEIELRDAVTARKGHNIRMIYGKREQEETRMVATENDTTSNYSLKKPRYFGKYFSLFSCMPFHSFSKLYNSLILFISFLLFYCHFCI